jgi:hypothetical protein
MIVHGEAHLLTLLNSTFVWQLNSGGKSLLIRVQYCTLMPSGVKVPVKKSGLIELSLSLKAAKKPIVDCFSHAKPVTGPLSPREPDSCEHSSEPERGSDTVVISRHHPDFASCHWEFDNAAFSAIDGTAVINSVENAAMEYGRTIRII